MSRAPWRKLLLAFVVVLLCAPLTFAQNANQFEVQAVFIYNFANFVEWPEAAFQNASDPFVVGVAGPNVFGNSLKEVTEGEMRKRQA